MTTDNASGAKKILLTTIGSRGEVQPVIALACELIALGHKPIACVPPNFKVWVESFGIECVTIGPELKILPLPDTNKKTPTFSNADIRQLLRASLVDQFRVTADAARGCDLVVTAGDLQHAARSVAEHHNIPYVHAIYCPVTLKSSDHPPPNLRRVNHLQNLPKFLNRLLWCGSDIHWNNLYRNTLNDHRAKLGLKPVQHVPQYIATEQPWFAVDPLLGPTPTLHNMKVIQTGAWLIDDKRPLPPAVEEFLAAGDAPIYFGFGSMPAGENTSRMLIEAARAIGRRTVISQGWADLDAVDSGTDCIVVGDVNHRLLFPRMAAIVHHGGAGTTTTAASSGRPQVIVPHIYDQYYWANRVQQLGIGVSAGRRKHLDVEKIVVALKNCLQPNIVEAADKLANRIELNGAKIAAKQIIAECR